MALTPVQVAFVREVVRPMIERIILFHSQLNSFVLDFDNQQAPLPTTGVALDDNNDGTAPRTDAPNLTGAQATQLRTFVLGMRDQVNTASLNTLINVAVRPVEVILRGGNG